VSETSSTAAMEGETIAKHRSGRPSARIAAVHTCCVTTTADAPETGAAAEVPSTPWWIGAIGGLAAAVSGLAVAELVSGLADSLRSPIISVSDRVIDNVPAPLKTWAIDTFGTNDKAVLLGVVAVLLAAFAAGVGVLTMRRGVRAGLVGVGVFTAIGVAASLGRGGGGAFAPLPSLIGGSVTGGALVWLMRRGGLPLAGDAHPVAIESPADVTRANAAARMSASGRRQFLGTAAGLTLGAAVIGGFGRWLREQGAVAAERLKIVLPTAASPLAAPPAGVELGVDGVTPFFTPNDDFYRIDTAMLVPNVDATTWTMGVTGMVGRSITLTYEELLARPMIEVDVTLACVSNEIGGSLVGNARWLGCRLDDLLDEAGIDPGADQIVGRSVDGFTAGFPTAVLDGRDAIVAVAMNGEPLPADHGYPARLVVPGLYGYVSATKWLKEIELTTFEAFQGYWIPRGWSAEGPIKTQCRIDVPTSDTPLAAGSAVPIAGVAWAPTRGITRVEVQVDDEPWKDATLGDEYETTTWRQWTTTWTPTRGEHRIRVRATDGTGETQTDEVTEVAPDGASGWPSRVVDVS